MAPDGGGGYDRRQPGSDKMSSLCVDERKARLARRLVRMLDSLTKPTSACNAEARKAATAFFFRVLEEAIAALRKIYGPAFAATVRQELASLTEPEVRP